MSEDNPGINGDGERKLWFNGAVKKVTWPLVSWIMSSSSSSSSSSYSSSYEYHDDDEVEISCQAQDNAGDNSATPSMETPNQSLSTAVTVAIPGILDNSYSSSKRRRLDNVTLALPCFEKKKESPQQKMRINWSQDDELQLLRSFLDYTTKKSKTGNNQQQIDISSSSSSFYDQVEPQLKLRFNKIQLVDKLRRLKRKYHNIRNNSTTGPCIDFRFKNPHDKATFEISHKIWSTSNNTSIGGHEEEISPLDLYNVEVKREQDVIDNDNSSGDRMLMMRPHTRSQCVAAAGLRSKRSVMEEEGSPLINRNNDEDKGGDTSGALKPIPVSLEGRGMKLGGGGELVDEKWKKQQIMELEVYSKRLELVQEQVKTTLEKLRSMGSTTSLS